MSKINRTKGNFFFLEIITSPGVPRHSTPEEWKHSKSFRPPGENSEEFKVNFLLSKTYCLLQTPERRHFCERGKHLQASEGQLQKHSCPPWNTLLSSVHFVWTQFNQHFCSSGNGYVNVNCYHSKVMEWECRYFKWFEARQSAISLALFLGNPSTKFCNICRSRGESHTNYILPFSSLM